MKVVLDTNVYVSTCFGGHAAFIISAWEAGRLRPVLSPALLAEHEAILGRHPMAKQEHLAKYRKLWEDLRLTEMLPENPPEQDWCKDVSDNAFIAAALAGKANSLITADKMLLTLVRINGVEILQARKFVAKYYQDLFSSVSETLKSNHLSSVVSLLGRDE